VSTARGRGPDLATLRQLAGFSQLGLARFSGLSLALIRALEDPDGAPPQLSDDQFERLADALVLSGKGADALRQALELPRRSASVAPRSGRAGMQTRRPARRSA
jgi:transcriptional regulator with XRE-family HTH domain